MAAAILSYRYIPEAIAYFRTTIPIMLPSESQFKVRRFVQGMTQKEMYEAVEMQQGKRREYALICGGLVASQTPDQRVSRDLAEIIRSSKGDTLTTTLQGVGLLTELFHNPEIMATTIATVKRYNSSQKEKVIRGIVKKSMETHSPHQVSTMIESLYQKEVSYAGNSCGQEVLEDIIRIAYHTDSAATTRSAAIRARRIRRNDPKGERTARIMADIGQIAEYTQSPQAVNSVLNACKGKKGQALENIVHDLSKIAHMADVPDIVRAAADACAKYTADDAEQIARIARKVLDRLKGGSADGYKNTTETIHHAIYSTIDFANRYHRDAALAVLSTIEEYINDAILRPSDGTMTLIEIYNDKKVKMALQECKGETTAAVAKTFWGCLPSVFGLPLDAILESARDLATKIYYTKDSFNQLKEKYTGEILCQFTLELARTAITTKNNLPSTIEYAAEALTSDTVIAMVEYYGEDRAIKIFQRIMREELREEPKAPYYHLLDAVDVLLLPEVHLFLTEPEERIADLRFAQLYVPIRSIWRTQHDTIIPRWIEVLRRYGGDSIEVRNLEREAKSEKYQFGGEAYRDNDSIKGEAISRMMDTFLK